jgi:hypothetical protein
MSLDSTSHPGRPGPDELVPSRSEFCSGDRILNEETAGHHGISSHFLVVAEPLLIPLSAAIYAPFFLMARYVGQLLRVHQNLIGGRIGLLLGHSLVSVRWQSSNRRALFWTSVVPRAIYKEQPHRCLWPSYLEHMERSAA